MVCLGVLPDGSPCPARLHGRGCAQITKGHASIGCFVCPSCLLRRLSPGATTFEPLAMWVAEEKMLYELSLGAEATGSSYHDYKRLEREFAESVGSFAGSIMPGDDPEVFKMFLWWMVGHKERALSLDSIFRTAGAVMMKTGRENLTTKGDVKAYYESLRESHGEESRPRTAATRRMIRCMMEPSGVIDT